METALATTSKLVSGGEFNSVQPKKRNYRSVISSSCVTFFSASEFSVLAPRAVRPRVNHSSCVCLSVCVSSLSAGVCVRACESLSLSLSLARYTCHTAADCLSIYTLFSLYSRRYLSPAPLARDDVRSTVDQRVKNQPRRLSDLY